MKQSARWIVGLISIVLYILFAIALIGAVELSVRGDIGGVVEFFQAKDMVVLLNLVIVTAVAGLCYGITNQTWMAFMAPWLLFGIMGFVNISKMKYHDIPFLPWDVFFFQDALRVAPALSNTGMDQATKIFLLIMGALFLVVLVVYLLADRPSKKVPRSPLKYIIELILIVCCVIILAGVSTNNQYRTDFFREHQLTNIVWDQKKNVVANGQVLTFTMNIGNMVISEPLNYSAPIMKKIDQELSQLEVSGKESPDVVVIMSESFSDPTKINGLNFSKDPMPHFRQIGREGITGDLYVPVLGGKTANTEFEFLTGYSAGILPEGSVPYRQYIKNDIRSLPRFLKQKGYYTTAIHNNIPEFWNRQKVYEHMGFDQFLSIEDFSNSTFYGNWMSDKDLTDKVIRTLEKKKSKDHQFVFAVTVQNHAPYDTPDSVTSIEVRGNLSEQDQSLMTKYVKGISVSDEELYRLYEYLKKREKPTILCFFGDHLPGGFEMYRTFPYFKAMNQSIGRKDMFSTPYLIWANYKSAPEEMDIGANAVAALMMSYGEADVPAIQNYNLSQYAGGDHENVYYSTKNMDGKMKAYRDYQYLLMYDDLFGKKYYNQ